MHIVALVLLLLMLVPVLVLVLLLLPVLLLQMLVLPLLLPPLKRNFQRDMQICRMLFEQCVTTTQFPNCKIVP